MSQVIRRVSWFVLVLLSLIGIAGETYGRDRVRGVIDGRVTVEKPGNRHPSARAELAVGDVSLDSQLDRMVLVLSGDPTQERALEALLDNQQDPASPSFHRWLTPEEFGRQFGASDSDIAKITAWLGSHGLTVEPAPANRRTLVFSGTAAQVQQAFSTRMKSYQIDGRLHIANASSPRIPAALNGIVDGIVSLHDFRKTGMVHSTPAFSAGGSHYLLPGDFATIYDAKALYSAGLDGTGTTIAVIGRSNIVLGDVAQFRTTAALPLNQPKVILNGRDPGLQSGDQMEATADVEWAGGVAAKASVILVTSASTNVADGIDLSASYAVNNNLAHVITVSYGLCEAYMGTAENKFWNALWQQAAAQGTSVLVSSGDSGAAGCDGAGSQSSIGLLGVNGLCSSPYSTCVGGTMLSGDVTSPTTYWSTSNAAGYLSALSYIPESAWNESGSAGGSGLWSTGGGVSNIYAKPGWQSAPGVPADGKRDVPDVSLSAAGHDGYIVPMGGANWSVSGTSLSTPSLAGLIAIAAQKQNARLGNANPVLYALATNQAKGGPAVFHDIVAGNNGVPGRTGFNAGPGFDLATGLGSVDAFVLVNHWSDGAAARPSFGIILSKPSASISPAVSASLRVSLSVANGFNSAVTLTAQGLPKGVTATFTPATLTGTSASSTLTIAADSTATPGPANIIVNGLSGTLTNSGALSVNVCTYALAPTSSILTAIQQTLSTKITAPTGCGWTGSSDSAWLTLASGATGDGTGVLNYTVAANPTTAQRQAILSAGGVSITIKQAGAPVSTFRLSNPSATLPGTGGVGVVSVTAVPSTAPWTATTTATWITLKTSAGQVTYTAGANNAAALRTGVVTIAGQSFTINQTGLACVSTLTPGRAITTATSISVGISITESANACTWSAVSNTSWIALPVAGSGRGNDVITLSVGSNPGPASRSGTMTVAGKTVTVVQAKGLASLTLTITP